MRAVTSPPESLSTPSKLRRQSSAFNTMETQFFKEGDELSTPPPTGNDDLTAATERRRRKRGLGTWLALAAAVVVACAVFAFLHARSNAEPAHSAPAGEVAASAAIQP